MKISSILVKWSIECRAYNNKKAALAATHFSRSEHEFTGRQMQKHRSTRRGNTHQRTGFFREFGFDPIPKMSPWHRCSERVAKPTCPHTFLLEHPNSHEKRRPWVNGSQSRSHFRINGGVFLKFKLVGHQAYWSFPQSSPRDPGAQSSQFIHLPVLQPWAVSQESITWAAPKPIPIFLRIHSAAQTTMAVTTREVSIHGHRSWQLSKPISRSNTGWSESSVPFRNAGKLDV